MTELKKTVERLLIVGSAATGYLMAEFSDMHEYIEQLLGRPVWTHEMAGKQFSSELKEKAKPDFVSAIKAVHAAMEQEG